MNVPLKCRKNIFFSLTTSITSILHFTSYFGVCVCVCFQTCAVQWAWSRVLVCGRCRSRDRGNSNQQLCSSLWGRKYIRPHVNMFLWLHFTWCLFLVLFPLCPHPCPHPGPSPCQLQSELRCSPSGQFESIQCDTNRGHCWCVDHDGMELYGTRQNGRPQQCEYFSH